MSNQPDKHWQAPLPIPSIPNLRDLAGHVTHGGRRVRTGLIYRSDQLSHVKVILALWRHHLI